MSVEENSSRMYQISIRHFNSSTGSIDYMGQILPYFPYQEVSRNISTSFYLKEAGTINITAVNSTGRTSFNYQVKDTQLGYTVADQWTSQVTEATVYVPRDRNYSVMIFPSQSMPVSYDWTNFSSSDSYSFGLSSYNASTYTLHKQFNTSMSLIRINGYISNANVIGWNSITAVPYLLQPGNMIFMSDSGYGTMPYNISAWNGQSDIYNVTNGFYNITVPGPAETQTILLYIASKNGSTNYGSYKNISIGYATSETQYNFTMYGLLGDYISNLTLQSATGGSSKKVETTKQVFRFVNSSTNATLSLNMETHAEVSVDYSAYGAMAFTFAAQAASGSSNFSIPLINATGIKEINIFSQDFAPRRVPAKTVAQVNVNNNITLSSFSPQTINGTKGSSISMAMLISNSSCNIPVPAAGCYVGGSGQNMGSFNPLSAVIGGGKISFRMGFGNISVHYVNVDMLASGPPDAAFDDAVTNTTSGSSFTSIMRFGSQGPTIYDYVLVSIPYVDSGIGTLNDSAPVNVSIPVFYDEGWNVVWNTTANGTSAASLAGNDSHYSAKQTEWTTLMTSKACTTGSVSSSSQINATSPCYIDTTNNKIWIRLPHFSGTGPEVDGTPYTATAAPDTIQFVSPTETSGTYINRSYILVNVTSNLTNQVNITIFLFNSTSLNATANTSAGVGSWVGNFSGLITGIYFFNATAANSSNWRNSTETRNVTIDTTLPASVVNNPVNYQNFTASLIIVNITASDTNFNYTYVALLNSTSGVANSSMNTTSAGSNTSLTAPYDGNFSVLVTVYDKAGSTNTTYRNITIDTTAPTITLISPLNNTIYYANQSINLNFAASDGGVGVSTRWYNVNQSTNVTFTVPIGFNFTSTGIKNLTLYANDSFNNLKIVLVTLNITLTPSTSFIANDSSYNVSSSTTNILVPYNSSLAIVTLENRTQVASIDLSQLTLGGVASIGENNISLISVGSANYTLFISAGTNITGGGSWGGGVNMPTVNSSTFTAPSLTGYTRTATVVLDMGTTTELNFTSPVKIVFGGRWGDKAAWARGNTTLTDISTQCDSLTAPTNISLTGSSRECYITSGSDLFIWTYHLTTFATYVQVQTTPVTSSSPGGGSLPIDTFSWANTFVYDDKEFSEKGAVTKEFLARNRIKLKVNGESHYVGVRSLTATNALVEIASASVNVTFKIGDQNKFDLNSDGYYDILVSLDKIVSSKATITVTPVHDVVPAVVPEAEGGIGDQIKEVGDNLAENVGKVAEGKASPWVYVILVAIIVLIIAYLLLRLNKKQRYKMYGY